MNNLFITISILFLLAGIINIFKILVVTRYFLSYKPKAITDVEELPFLCILIPMLNEEKIVKSIIKSLSKINYPLDKYLIQLITTEKETLYRKTNATKLLIERYLKVYNPLNLEHLNFPYKLGGKADQLNYCLNSIETKLLSQIDTSNVFIGVYDADSVIESDTFRIIGSEIARTNYLDAYQQPPIYLRHLLCNKLSKKESLLLANSLYQTSFSFFIEGFNILYNNSILKKYIFRKTIHMVGHGMYIKYPTLRKVGMFPSPYEDSRVGHMFSFLNLKIGLLTTPDICEVPRALANRFIQTRNWFIGLTYILKDYKKSKILGNKSALNSMILIGYRLWRNLIWMSRGPLLLLTFIYFLLLNKPYFAFFILLVFYYIPICITIVSVIFIWGTKYSKLKINLIRNFLQFNIILFPIDFFLTSVAAIWGFLCKYIIKIPESNFILKTKYD